MERLVENMNWYVLRVIGGKERKTVEFLDESHQEAIQWTVEAHAQVRKGGDQHDTKASRYKDIPSYGSGMPLCTARSPPVHPSFENRPFLVNYFAISGHPLTVPESVKIHENLEI